MRIACAGLARLPRLLDQGEVPMLSRARWPRGTAALCSLALVLLAGSPLLAQAPCCPANETFPEGWARADLLLWHVNGSGIPALVTASPPGTPQTVAGVLGNPNTVTYFGNQHINNEIRPGFSLEAGWIGLGDHDYPLGV